MAAEETKRPETLEPIGPEVRSSEEARIREAVRVAIASCRQCEEGGDCVGALMELFRYLPPEVKSIVDDEQARALEQIVGGD